MNSRKTLDTILLGTSDHNIRFNDVTGMLRAMGFAERIRGSHHIYKRAGIPGVLNLQPTGSMAKAYQIEQVRAFLERNDLLETL